MGPARVAEIRVQVIENHEVVGDGIAALINDQPDMKVVGRTNSVMESLEHAHEFKPDVVLVDYHLGDGTGIEAVHAIRQKHPMANVIVLSHDDGMALQSAVLQAGASGFIHKSADAATLLVAVRAVAAGKSLFTPQDVATLLAAGKEMDGRRASLTAREIEVVRLMASGMSNREIATALVISYTTVRTHLRSISLKLGAHSKIQTLARARELQLLG